MTWPVLAVKVTLCPSCMSCTPWQQKPAEAKLMKIVPLCRTTAQIQRDLKTAIKMKHAAKKGPLGAPCESSTYPDVSPADAAGIQDDASSALCNAMGDLGIDPEVRSTAKEAQPNLPTAPCEGVRCYLALPDRVPDCSRGSSLIFDTALAVSMLSPRSRHD